MNGLPDAQRQENFSLAYVRAIAAERGFSVHRPEDDYDSIDLVITARGSVTFDGRTSKPTSPSLALQVKCTFAKKPKDGQLKYPLPVKNYNDLRDPGRILPAILVVLHVPERWSQRLSWTEKSLIMRRCAYWKNLRGEPATTNQDNITIKLTDLFSPIEMTRLMFLAAEEEL